MLQQPSVQTDIDVMAMINAEVDKHKAAVYERSQPWSEDEDDFLRASLGFLSEDAIGAALGRTQVAVRIRWKRDLGLPAPTKSPGFLTANRTAKLLDVDNHAVCRWIEEDMLPAHRLPFRNRGCWRIRVHDLKRFVIRPEHWLLFRPERVGELPKAWSKTSIRRLVVLAVERWNDSWLTTQEAADILGVEHTDVNRVIHRGMIPSIKWANRYVRRSDVEKEGVYIPKRGKGHGHESDAPGESDAFLVLAKAVGCTFTATSRLMGMPDKYASSRYGCLLKGGHIPYLIGKYGLDVAFNGTHCLADWKEHYDRFPTVGRAMRYFEEGVAMTFAELAIVRAVMWTWSVFHLGTGTLTRRLHSPWGGRSHPGRNAADERLCALCAELEAQGIDPWTQTV